MTDAEFKERLSESKSLLRQYRAENQSGADFAKSQVDTFLRDILTYLGLGSVYQNIQEKVGSKDKWTPKKLIDFEFDQLSQILDQLTRETAQNESDYSSERDKISDRISDLASDIASLNFGSTVSAVDRYTKQKNLKSELEREKQKLANKTYDYYKQSADLDQKTRKVQRQMDDVSSLKLEPYFEQITKITKGDN
jgi:hypothetical protein